MYDTHHVIIFTLCFALVPQMQQQPKAKPNTLPKARVAELSAAEVEKEAGNDEFKAGRWEAAVAHYSAAIELDPTLVVAHNNRAMAHLKLVRA